MKSLRIIYSIFIVIFMTCSCAIHNNKTTETNSAKLSFASELMKTELKKFIIDKFEWENIDYFDHEYNRDPIISFTITPDLKIKDLVFGPKSLPITIRSELLNIIYQIDFNKYDFLKNLDNEMIFIMRINLHKPL